MLIFIIFLISASAKALCDRIKFKADFGGDWVNARGKYSWDKRTWLTKNIFSFISDGWHLFDAIRVMSLCLLGTIALSIPIYWALVFYIIHGLAFETLYRIK